MINALKLRHITAIKIRNVHTSHASSQRKLSSVRKENFKHMKSSLHLASSQRRLGSSACASECWEPDSFTKLFTGSCTKGNPSGELLSPFHRVLAVGPRVKPEDKHWIPAFAGMTLGVGNAYIWVWYDL